jgi:hypothetical protein
VAPADIGREFHPLRLRFDILVIAYISTKCVSMTICSVISKILKYILISDLS